MAFIKSRINCYEFAIGISCEPEGLAHVHRHMLPGLYADGI